MNTFIEFDWNSFTEPPTYSLCVVRTYGDLLLERWNSKKHLNLTMDKVQSNISSGGNNGKHDTEYEHDTKCELDSIFDPICILHIFREKHKTNHFTTESRSQHMYCSGSVESTCKPPQVHAKQPFNHYKNTHTHRDHYDLYHTKTEPKTHMNDSHSTRAFEVMLTP